MTNSHKPTGKHPGGFFSFYNQGHEKVGHDIISSSTIERGNVCPNLITDSNNK